MGAVSYKGYVANVDVDVDAKRLIGRVVNSRVPLEFDTSAASDVLRVFHEVIDSYLAACAARGVEPSKPYSGKLLLRIDPRMHAAVATDAARVGRSINGWVEQAIVKALEDSADDVAIVPD